jgi:hypothetical protein
VDCVILVVLTWKILKLDLGGLGRIARTVSNMQEEFNKQNVVVDY